MKIKPITTPPITMARKEGRISLTGRLVGFFTENAIEGGSMSLVVFEFLWSGLDERNPGDTHKRTPLSWAAKHGQTDTAKLLLDHRRGQSASNLVHVDFDEEDESGETVLDWAVKNEHDGVLHLLIESELSCPVLNYNRSIERTKVSSRGTQSVKILTAAKYLCPESWHVDGRVWILSAAAEACLNSMTHAVVLASRISPRAL